MNLKRAWITQMPPLGWAVIGLSCVAASMPHARANTLIPLGAASNYVILYNDTGGHNLHVTNDTVGGNVGVGGTGKVQFSGPGTITGSVIFGR